MTPSRWSRHVSKTLLLGLCMTAAVAGGPDYNQPSEGSQTTGEVLRSDPGLADHDALITPASIASRDDFGFEVITADFDGDGFDDWAVGYPQSDEVRVYFGGLHRPYGDPLETSSPVTSSPATRPQTSPVTISGPVGSRFGASLAASQVDSSGNLELVVGAPGTASRCTSVDPTDPTQCSMSPGPAGMAFVVWNVSGTATCDSGGSNSGCQLLGRPGGTALEGDHFGWAVAASGTTVVVSAPRWFQSNPTIPVGRLDFFRFNAFDRGDGMSLGRAVKIKSDRRRPSRRSLRGQDREISSLLGGSGVGHLQAVIGVAVGPDDVAPIGTPDFPEELGESLAVCNFGPIRIAAGAVGADLVRFYDINGVAQGMPLLDPDLADIDDADRPGGLFGSALVCGDFVGNDDDELAVSAVIRDWDAANYVGLPDDPSVVVDNVPRANGGGVFVFDSAGVELRRLLPQTSGEFLGYSIAASRLDDRTFGGDPFEALIVGTSRFDFLTSTPGTASETNPAFGAPGCELDYANGAVLALDVDTLPASVVLTEGNLAALAPGQVNYRVYGLQCAQLGGAVAAGDTNNDGWAEILAASQVDPNEDFLVPNFNPRGQLWMFTTNDFDGDGEGNVLDADDDDDCFADAWEDRNANGTRESNETRPFQADINAFVQNLTVTCDNAPCVPGNQANELTVTMTVHRSCLELLDPSIGSGTLNDLFATVTISQGDLPVKGNLSLQPASTFGAVEDDATDPFAQIVTWTLTSTNGLPLPTPPAGQLLTAVLDIDNPVVADFPNQLEVNVDIAVRNAADQPLIEARGVFNNQLIGLVNDNVDGPEFQTIQATAQPMISWQSNAGPTPGYCMFNGADVPCLPNSLLVATETHWNEGERNLAADFDIAMPLPANALRCPGDVLENCFPAGCSGPVGSDTVPTEDHAICIVPDELFGNTTEGAPGGNTPKTIQWQIRAGATATSVSPEIKLRQGAANDTDMDGVNDVLARGPAPVAVPLALPDLTLTGSCDAGCLPNTGLTFTALAENDGDAAADGTLIFPIPADTSCIGVCVSDITGGETVACSRVTSNGADSIRCDFTVPATPGQVDFDIDLTVAPAPAGTQVAGDATAYFPECATDDCAVSVFSANSSDTVDLSNPALTVTTQCFEVGNPGDPDASCDIGDAIQYDVSVTNNGAGAIPSARLLIDIPAGTSCANPADCAINESGLSCSGLVTTVTCDTTGAIPPAGSVSMTLDLVIEPAASGTTLDSDVDLEIPAATLFTTENVMVAVDTAPTITIGDGMLNEGDAGGMTLDFAVTLSAMSDLTVTVDYDTVDDTAAAPGDYTAVAGGMVSFAPGSTMETISITIVNDGDVEGDEQFFVDLSNAFRGIIDTNQDRGTGTIVDNDTVGVIVTESGGSTDVTEGGATDTYSVVLGSQPSGNVAVTITPDGQSMVAGSPIMFTGGNWDTPVDVTVTAVDDGAAEGAHTSTISHAVTSSDMAYDGIAVDDVTANITDDDGLAVLIAESAGSTDVTEGGSNDTYTVVLDSEPSAPVTITFTTDAQVTPITPILFDAMTWDVPQMVTVIAVDDGAAEGAHMSTISHAATSTDMNYDGIMISDVTANITDNDSLAVLIAESAGSTDVTEGGSNDAYTVRLDSEPSAPVTITFTTDAQVTPIAPIMFDAMTWDVPQMITVIAVDDGAAEGAHMSTISHAATSTDMDYDGIMIGDVTASITDNDSLAVLIVESGGSTAIQEGGLTDTYDMVLDSQPSAPVTITFMTDAQVMPIAPIMFNAGDWDMPKTVTLVAVDDGDIEGAHMSVVSHAATSTDMDYDGIAIADVTATITDND